MFQMEKKKKIVNDTSNGMIIWLINVNNVVFVIIIQLKVQLIFRMIHDNV